MVDGAAAEAAGDADAVLAVLNCSGRLLSPGAENNGCAFFSTLILTLRWMNQKHDVER
jgi:hypothetical protein